jgi:hypothetical protein
MKKRKTDRHWERIGTVETDWFQGEISRWSHSETQKAYSTRIVTPDCTWHAEGLLSDSIQVREHQFIQMRELLDKIENFIAQDRALCAPKAS